MKTDMDVKFSKTTIAVAMPIAISLGTFGDIFGNTLPLMGEDLGIFGNIYDTLALTSLLSDESQCYVARQYLKFYYTDLQLYNFMFLFPAWTNFHPRLSLFP